MSVKLRMTRIGRRHRPFFRINAVDSRHPRDGKVVEKLGHYDPIEKDESKQVVLDLERVKYWLDKGAIPSDTVSQILLRLGIKHKYAEETTTRRARARAIARAKGVPFTEIERTAAGKQAEQAEEKTKAEAEAKTKAVEKAKVDAKAKPEVVKEEAKVQDVKAKGAEAKTKSDAPDVTETQAKAEAVETTEEKTAASTEVKAETKPRPEEQQQPEDKEKPAQAKETEKSDEN